MDQLGDKIARKRKDLGMTQIEFARQLSVTRQTVSRWETNTMMLDIDKIGDIANVLNVTCDYLLKDEVEEDTKNVSSVSHLLYDLKGKTIRIQFFDEEMDIDLFKKESQILDFEGNWIKVEDNRSKGKHRKIDFLIIYFIGGRNKGRRLTYECFRFCTGFFRLSFLS